MKTFSLVNAPHLPVTGESHPLTKESTRWLTTGNAVALLGALAIFGALYLWSELKPVQAVVIPPMVDPYAFNPDPEITPNVVVRGVAPKSTTARGTYEPAPDPVPFDDDPDPGVNGGVIPGEPGPVTNGPFEMPGFTPSSQVADTIVAFDELPVLLSIAAPVYPELVQQAGIDGTVLVKVLVARTGKVKQAVAVDGPDVFWASAIKAARTALFTPAKQNDTPVDVWVVIPITFSLNR